MTVRLKQVNPGGTRVFMGTLTGGVEVLEALAETAVTHHIQTATMEMLGGLTQVELTAYDFERQERLPPLLFVRPLEIIAGHGTISLLDGRPHVHLHLALAYRDENRIAVIGGHCARALAFAVEFTLTAYDGAPMHRAMDEGTGLMLWQGDNVAR